MHLRALRLHQFRNHLNSSFEFGDGTNVLLGDNGQGKTNVIEAISYLCLTRSFYANSDTLALNFEKDSFEVDGRLLSDRGVEHHVHVAYLALTGEKAVTVNRQRVEPFASIIGQFPIVICSPEHAPITAAGPLERRRFVDFVISQSSKIYFQNLIEYRRVLKQRNRILLDAKLARRDATPLLEPWDEQIVEHGGMLMERRRQFVEEFREFITPAYRRLVEGAEQPSMEYVPLTGANSATPDMDFKGLLRAGLREKRDEEQRVGTTLVGPHRDEFTLKIDGLDLRKFASQGQHKTFLVALKIGEFFYLNDRCRETPIMLLDDVFSELDERRAACVLEFVETLSQTFITSTNPHLFNRADRPAGRISVFHLHGGAVVEGGTIAA